MNLSYRKCVPMRHPFLMFSHSMRNCCYVFLLLCPLSLRGQQVNKVPPRDPLLLEVLSRVVNAAGGPQVFAAVHDLSETGVITFHWTKDVKGSLSIGSLRGNHFRMEAELPEKKQVWLVNDGVGSVREGQKTVNLTYSNSINLENLTFPIEYIEQALADPAVDISLLRIEEREGRSVYHLRLKGRLGLVRKGLPCEPVVKDIRIDALTFEVITVEDFPYSRKPISHILPVKSNEKTSDDARKSLDVPPREITYQDFRNVDGMKLPFSIDIRLEGQRTFSIRFDAAEFNTGLNIRDFAN
jgi:hypothetical protein